jgi:hypothetical protein
VSKRGVCQYKGSKCVWMRVKKIGYDSGWRRAPWHWHFRKAKIPLRFSEFACQ